jgi:hypothetical protein
MPKKKKTVSVPVGLEQLLVAAAIEPAFRRELVRERAVAAARRGLVLTDSERLALDKPSAAQLETMIDRIDTSEQNLERSGILRAVAAAAITLAAGTGIQACGGSSDKPATETDVPFQGAAEKIDNNEIELQIDQTPMPAGILPDPPDAGAPTLDIHEPDPQGKGGARPDIE